jgi:hypothetical protein
MIELRRREYSNFWYREIPESCPPEIRAHIEKKRKEQRRSPKATVAATVLAVNSPTELERTELHRKVTKAKLALLF